MRETPAKKIIRLEQEVAKLKQESKLLKSQLRTFHKNSRSDSIETNKTHKKEMTRLQTEMSKMRLTWESEKNELEKKLEEARGLADYWREKAQELDANERQKQERIRQEREKRQLLEECHRYDDSRLEYFTSGLYCDRDQREFIDSMALILHINPHTGAFLSLDGFCTIYNLIKDHPYYQQKLEEAKKYRGISEYDEGYFESKSAIHSIGVDIYKKLYPDFSFDQFSI
jgi:hypothetical protein